MIISDKSSILASWTVRRFKNPGKTTGFRSKTLHRHYMRIYLFIFILLLLLLLLLFFFFFRFTIFEIIFLFSFQTKNFKRIGSTIEL